MMTIGLDWIGGGGEKERDERTETTTDGWTDGEIIILIIFLFITSINIYLRQVVVFLHKNAQYCAYFLFIQT